MAYDIPARIMARCPTRCSTCNELLRLHPVYRMAEALIIECPKCQARPKHLTPLQSTDRWAHSPRRPRRLHKKATPFLDHPKRCPKCKVHYRYTTNLPPPAAIEATCKSCRTTRYLLISDLLEQKP